MEANGLVLLGIVVTIGVVAEHCRALRYLPLTIPPINAGWPVAKTSVMKPFCNAKKRCEGTVL